MTRLATYRAVMITKVGGPEVLEVVELPLRDPEPGELRVRVRAAGCGSTDVTMLTGTYIYAPKIPFVPGYECVGVVDALGTGVTGFSIGQRVAALTVHGSFAEVIYRGAEHFMPVPDSISDVDAAAVILNYVTAWQAIHRVGRVAAGHTALVTAAAGGVGTAALQLLRIAGVKTYGAASEGKHAMVRALGATPLDYRSGKLDALVRALEPGGVDFVFDGVGGPGVSACIGALRRGGKLVAYGFMAGSSRAATAALFARVYLLAPLRWRRGAFYAITMRYRRDPQALREDLAQIYTLLADRQIDPLVTRQLPLSEAKQALELLVAGNVQGKLVLTA